MQRRLNIALLPLLRAGLANAAADLSDHVMTGFFIGRFSVEAITHPKGE
jgi:hypothetical protein